MTKKIIISMMLIVFTIFILGCGKEFVPTDDSGTTKTGMAGLAESNNKFAFDMYAKLNTDQNLFFSPYSLSAALAMVYEGAKGETAEEIKNVFYFPEDKGAFRSSFAGIYNNLNKEDKKYKLHTANAMWAQQDYTFLPSYVQTLNNYYGALSENLDFINDATGSAEKINDWVKDKTDGKITDLVSPSALNAQTRLVLTNAIYFKGTWEDKFDKDDTDDEEFWITPEEKIITPMMELTDEHFRYGETDNLQIIELPYKGYELSMFVILPKYIKENGLAEVEESLNAEKLKELQSQMHNQLVYLHFPKFKFDLKYSMAEILADMGMPLAFTWPGADFSEMDGTTDLYINKVLHHALIDVDEKGTTAIAATGVFVGVGSVAPSEPVTFRADHPFMFLIQERMTGNILFIGKVVDPS
jgi:serpin B